MSDQNVHAQTVKGFGEEWERFDQSKLPPDEHRRLFEAYFGIFPWDNLKSDAEGFDMGCGSGRWAQLVAPRVGKLHCIDPSSALGVAKRNLKAHTNCFFHQGTADQNSLADKSMDFGYSLGVLHHTPDTQAALAACVRKLRPGAPFLLYLYYAFDNRPAWFRAIWHVSNALRHVISRLPKPLKFGVSQVIAACIYWPLAKIAAFLERQGWPVENFPLAAYRQCSFYTMSTDALDRFGTQLEQRFTRHEIHKMMEDAGLRCITFSTESPYWCAVGYRKA